ncbi:hypothetical protein [Sporolactobacillus vineae]|uniref:hypothetical protein n=1 Tax=Sporolactobacillus vineae TaxID=444463 RepID=UPI000288B9E4|nr:hypothetical protein [Sporolactobacillus vineae]
MELGILNKHIRMTRRNQISYQMGQISFIISLFYFILQVSAIPFQSQLQDSYLLVFVTVAAVTKFLIQEEHDFKYTLFLSLFLLLSIVVSIQAHDCMPVIMVMLATLTHDLDLNTMAKAAFLTLSLSLVILYLLSLSGLIVDYHAMREGIMRHSFGLTQPTLFSDLVFFAVAAYVYIRKRLSLISICLILALAAITYYYANARNDTMGILLLAVAPFLLKHQYPEMIKHIGKTFALCSYPLFAIIVVAVTKMYAYNKGIIGNIHLNEMLTGRLYLGNLAFKRYPIQLFGQHVIENAGGRVNFYNFIPSYFYIDSSYLHLLFKFGLIFTFLFFIVVISKIYQFLIQKDYLLIAIVIIVGIETLWEANLFSPLNFTLLMLTADARSTVQGTQRLIHP